MQGRARTDTTFNLKYAWGQAGTLYTGDSNQQVTMQAQLPEASTYTAQFSRGDNGASDKAIIAEAQVTWGVEGNFVSRRVNVVDGMSLVGVGQSVKIIMIDRTLNPAQRLPYEVAVQVSIGVRGTSKQPPILIPGDVTIAAVVTPGRGTYTIPATSSGDVDIPQDAGVIALHTTVESAGHVLTQTDATVELVNGAAVVKAWPAVLYPDWVPIFPGAKKVRMVNSSANPIVFSLAYGIDG